MDKKGKIMKSELISIILPVFNGESTIERCIKSILNQTYEYFELIIVNDGSTDGTKSILSKINDDRIIIINQKNQGTGIARNTGMKSIKGKFVVFIDADDEVDENFLQVLMLSMIENDSDIVCMGNKNKNLNSYEYFNELIKLPETISIGSVGKLFKVEVIKNIKFIDNKYEDVDFMLNTYFNVKKVTEINQKLYKIYKCENSRSSHYETDDRLQSCIKVSSKIPNCLINNYKTYCIANCFGILNKMILNNNYRNDLIKEINLFIKENIKYVCKSDYNLFKKMQIYLYYKFPKLYINLYKLRRII